MESIFNCTDKDFVLFVGEGNFIFSSNLIKNEIKNNINISGKPFVSTCFQAEDGNEPRMNSNLENVRNELKSKNIEFLRNSSCQVLFGVDAVELDTDDRFVG